MKKRSQLIVYIFTVFFCVSCVTKYRIQEHEYNLIPYKGTEQLVFTANDNKTDTIVLKPYKDWSKTESVPYRVFHNKYERYGIEFVHNAMNTTNSSPNFIVEIHAFNWKGLRIKLRTKSENMNYKNNTSFTVAEFDSIPLIKMKINESVYTDVKVFLGEKYEVERNDQITQFYWSKKNGLIGWDCNTVLWRLHKKIIP